MKFKQIRQSLITRLMVYFLLVGIFLVAIFGIKLAHNLQAHFKQEILPNIAQYLSYIVLDIGTPPDLEKAERLSRDLSFELKISGPGINWSSDHSIPSIEKIEFEPGPAPYQEFLVARHRGENFVMLQQGDYEYLYIIGRKFKSADHQRGLGFIFVIIISMTVLFFLIRSSLKPLKMIGNGVNKIAQGDLDQPVEIHGSLEFKRLSQGINDMALQIKSMLEAKQQLLLAISHELRSPITRAKVNLELLPEQPIKQALVDDINEMQELVGMILESERLNQRHAALNKTELRLDQLIEQIIKQYFSSDTVTAQLEALTLQVDETRISLMIKNLLDNALKYSSEEDPAPVIRIYSENGQVIIDVKDEGCGMEAEELDQITKAFYRVDEARQRSTGGFGLGLYLCHLIVQAHGGTIQFQSEPNQGTTVIVSLPLDR